MPKKSLADIEAKLVHETDKAYLLDDGQTKEWVPKSRVENNDRIEIGQRGGSFSMPEDLAIEKGFV